MWRISFLVQNRQVGGTSFRATERRKKLPVLASRTPAGLALQRHATPWPTRKPGSPPSMRTKQMLQIVRVTGPQPRPPALGTLVLLRPQENFDSLFITFANMFVRSYRGFHRVTPDRVAGEEPAMRRGGEHRTSASGKPGALATLNWAERHHPTSSELQGFGAV